MLNRVRFSAKTLLSLSVVLLFGAVAFVFSCGKLFDSKNTLLSVGASSGEYTNGGTHYQRDNVPVERVDLSASVTTVRPGQSINLDVVITPQWASSQNVLFQFMNGAIQANINGNVLTVRPNATIGATISIVAVVDSVRSSTLSFVIEENPVESVKISNTQASINQGASLRLNTVIEPVNATNRIVVYQIIEGNQFATVSADGVVRVNANLQAGNLQIKVQVQDLRKVT